MAPKRVKLQGGLTQKIPSSIEVVWPKLDDFRDLILVLEELHEDVSFLFDNDGLMVHQYDPSKVSLTKLKLKKEYFDVYNYKGEGTWVPINSDAILKVLSCYEPNSKLTMTRNHVTHPDSDGTLFLEFNALSGATATCGIHLTETDNDLPLGSSQTEGPFANEIEMNPSFYRELSANIQTINGDFLAFSLDHKKQEFKVIMKDADKLTYEDTLRNPDKFTPGDNENGPPVFQYKFKKCTSSLKPVQLNVDHIAKFKAPKITYRSTISFSDEVNPVDFKHSLGKDGTAGYLAYMIPPKSAM